MTSRLHVAQTILIGLGEKASFEFHVSNWAGGNDRDMLPIAPEVTRLSRHDTLCLYGDGDSSCPAVSPQNAAIQSLPGGHHFGGSYDDLVDVIVKRSRMK